MSNFPIDRNRCVTYRAGHCVHHIQAFRSVEDPVGWPALVSINADGLIVVTMSEHTSLWWNHDPERLGAILKAADGQGYAQPKWHVLQVPSSGHSHIFNLAPAADISDCRPRPLRGTHSGRLGPEEHLPSPGAPRPGAITRDW